MTNDIKHLAFECIGAFGTSGIISRFREGGVIVLGSAFGISDAQVRVGVSKCGNNENMNEK